MKTNWSFIIKFVLIGVLLSYVFRINKLIGAALVIVVLVYIFYSRRASYYAVMGTTRYSNGDKEGALEFFRKAYNTKRSVPRMALSYAYLLLRAGRIDETEEIINELLSSKLTPQDEVSVKSNLALVLWKKEKLDEAIELLEELHAKGKNTVVYGSLGYFYILKGDLDKALEYNDEAYKFNNADNIILDNLGQVYYLKCEYDKSKEIYEKLIERKPSFPEAYYNYGLVLFAKGELEAAFENVKKALEYETSFLTTLSKEQINEKVSELNSLLNKEE